MATQKASQQIDFFIDSDKKKTNNFFCGKKILHPDEIKNWKELYVYVPFNYYEEISLKLELLGLKENINYSKYEGIGYLSEDAAEKDYTRAMMDVQERKGSMSGKFLLWGAGWNKRGYERVLCKLLKTDRTPQMALISEDVTADYEGDPIRAEIPFIIAPKIFNQEIYIKAEQIEKGKSEYNKCIELEERVEQLKHAFPHDVNAELMVCYMYDYICRVIEELKPKGILCFASITTSHKVLKYVCEKNQIPIIYTHMGVLPGTLAFDTMGEVGESLPAVFADQFLKLPVSTYEIMQAQNVWDYLKRSKLNRKCQPKNQCIDYILKRKKAGRPIVLFAAQNDVYANMIPYTEDTKIYHSPIFKTSLDAGIYLAQLCEKRDWNFVYKPHPMYIQENLEKYLPSNTIYVKMGDINDLIDASDVVVTILSQTNYVALIRYKPVVMLGYNQTKNKGCTYEAFEQNNIECTIQKALEEGFTQKQQKAFLKHVAQILKYYLYDDGREREVRFGREAPQNMNEFYELDRLLSQDGTASIQEC